MSILVYVNEVQVAYRMSRSITMFLYRNSIMIAGFLSITIIILSAFCITLYRLFYLAARSLFHHSFSPICTILLVTGQKVLYHTVLSYNTHLTHKRDPLLYKTFLCHQGFDSNR